MSDMCKVGYKLRSARQSEAELRTVVGDWLARKGMGKTRLADARHIPLQTRLETAQEKLRAAMRKVSSVVHCNGKFGMLASVHSSPS